MARSRELRFVLTGDTRDLERAFKTAGRGANRLGDDFGNVARRGARAFAALGAAATAGLVVAAKTSLQTASDINESITKNQQLFGRYAKGIEQFAESSARSFGISKAAALDYTGIFGNLARAQGVGQQAAADMSVQLTKLGADLASFNNASIEDVLQAIRSGLVGEVEPLRRFGVALSVDAVKAEALRIGLVKVDKTSQAYKDGIMKVNIAEANRAKAIKEHGANSVQAANATLSLHRAQQALTKSASGASGQLSAQQKIMATQSLIFRQTQQAQGDFERTSKGLANQQRILQAEFKDVAGTLGTALLPGAVKVTNYLTSHVTPAFQHAADGIAKTFKRDDLDFGEKMRRSMVSVRHHLGPLAKELQDAIKRANLGDKLRQAIDFAVPKIMDAAAHAAPKAALAFVNAFRKAGIWGQLLTAGFLAQRLGVFSGAGQFAAKKMGQALKRVLIGEAATAGVAAGAAAAGGEGLTSRTSFDAIRSAGKRLGTVGGRALRVGIILGLADIGAEIIAYLKKQLGHDKDNFWDNLLPDSLLPDTNNFSGPLGKLLGLHKTPTTSDTLPKGKRNSVTFGRGGGSQAIPRPSGGVWNQAQLERLWVVAGGDPKMATTMARIAIAESGGRESIVNSIGATGLWQIHPGGAQYKNPLTNARTAVQKLRTQGLKAWEVVTKGMVSGVTTGTTSDADVGALGGGGMTFTDTAVDKPSAEDIRKHRDYVDFVRTQKIRRAEERRLILSRRKSRTREQGFGRLLDRSQRNIDLTAQEFDLTEEDLTTEGGRQTRAKELTTLRKLQAQKQDRQKKRLAAVQSEMKANQRILAVLKVRLKAAKRAATRKKIRDRISAIGEEIDSLRQEAVELGFDIRETGIEVQDLTGQISQALVGQTPDEEAKPFGSDILEGAEGTIGNIDLRQRAGVITPEEARAQKIAFLTGEIGRLEAAPGIGRRRVENVLLQLKAMLNDVLGESIEPLASEIKDLTDAINRQNQISESIIGVTSREAIRALADSISGQIAGFGVAPRAQTAGSGVGARY